MGFICPKTVSYTHLYTVNPIEGLELSDQLHDAVKYIHGTYQEAELPELGEGEAIDTSIPADPNVKNYSYAIVDGQVYYRENSRMAVSYTHLADADSYDPKYAKWRYDDLPILPEHWQMVVGKDKKTQFDILKKLMNAPDVTEVVNACDAGREGELIFRSVYELAGCQKPMKRLWISSMEDSAIREGFANLRPGVDYDGLRDAALCRAKADWLVGINATRLFSVLYHLSLIHI